MKTLLLATSALLSLAAPMLARAQDTAVDRVVVTGGRASRTSPDMADAALAISRTPGAVEVVPDTAFKTGPASTIKDMLAAVPGVVIQSRYGPDARVSIRGSGLSRAYGNRGVTALVDGVPINTSDGLLDLSEVDPSAYRYVEVYKGANALRYGANSLGGAINFVTPTGRTAQGFDGRFDVGSFGFTRIAGALGGSAGALDGVINVSAQREDGFRAHADQSFQRLNGNAGFQPSANLETRFYVNAYRWRALIPGEVDKSTALTTPRAANPDWVAQDQQRNINSVRLTNKTSWTRGATTIDAGAYGLYRHVMHPIFQWLDFTAKDYGAFARIADDRRIRGMRNTFVAGVNLNRGTIDTEQFVNLPGAIKGALAASTVDRSHNHSAYAENALYVRPDVSLVAGVQYLHAKRDRRDRYLTNGDQSGAKTYDLWSPKVGVLWDADPNTQLFANLSRSAEVPTYDANGFASPASSTLKAQTATTAEVGARGRRSRLRFDVSAYRAQLRNELQCLTTGPFSACSVINAGKTVHQGIEAGLFAPLGEQITLSAAYTFNDFAFDGDTRYGDNELPGVPRHLLRAEAQYNLPGGLSFGPNLEWSPQAYFADNANSLTVDAFALWGLKLSYDAPGGWSAYLEGRNLGDRVYISTVAVAGTATAGSELFNAGAGRSAHAGLRYRW